jgi:hypothetical protein
MFTLEVDTDIGLRLHDLYDLQAYYDLIKQNYDHIGP